MLERMKREDIKHLALLARVRLSEKEMENFESELSSIMSYVSVVSEIVADDAKSEPQVGARYNVFRQDKVTNEPDQYTNDIIAEMPSAKGRFLSVKKILQMED